jgi:hypothetical protein
MSFANNQVFADDISSSITYSTEVYPLGTERLMLGSQSTVGDQVWIFIKNGAGSALAQGDVVSRKDSTISLGTVVKAPLDASSASVVGVAQFAIADGAYGWVLKRGIGRVKSGADAIVANSPIVVQKSGGVGVAGTAMPAAALGAAAKFDTVIAYSHEAPVAGVARCTINCW